MRQVLVILLALLLTPIGLYFILSSTDSQKLASPLLKTNKVVSLNQWFPKEVLGAQTQTPEITAKSAFFVETKTGQVLYSKNPEQQLPIASLVKVMTALVALENRNLDEKLWVSSRASEMEPDKMNLAPGEELSLKELLYGVFLVSANDGAEVLAEASTGNRAEFINLMNDKAKQLGMKNSFFVNPTGLDEDISNSFSSAYDLSLLTRYAIRKFPVLVDISKTEHITLPQTEDHQDYDMYSGINLLTTYPGVIGFKTGFTPEAGLTLITLAQKDGHEIVGVLLGSENRRDEARELLDYSFSLLSGSD